MVPTDGRDVVVDAWFPLMVGMLLWMDGSNSWLGCCGGWIVPSYGWDVVVDGWFPLMVGMLW